MPWSLSLLAWMEQEGPPSLLSLQHGCQSIGNWVLKRAASTLISALVGPLESTGISLCELNPQSSCWGPRKRPTHTQCSRVLLNHLPLNNARWVGVGLGLWGIPHSTVWIGIVCCLFWCLPPPYAPPMWSIPNRTQGLGKGTNLPAQLALCFLLELTPTTLQLACRLYKFMQDAWLNGRSHLLVSSFRARTDENRCRAWEKNNCIFCFDSRSAGGMLTCSPLLNISVASFFHFPLLCCCR